MANYRNNITMKEMKNREKVIYKEYIHSEHI